MALERWILESILGDPPPPPRRDPVANNPSPRGGITVDIQTAPGRCGATVKARGSHTSVIDDDDRRAFELTSGVLKQAVEEYHGKEPSSVYVKSPTPRRDLYTKNSDWYPVTKTVEVLSARVTDVDTTIIPIASRRYVNTSDESGTFKTSFSETARNIVSTRFSAELELSAGVTWNLKFPGSVNMGIKAKCGGEVNRTQDVTVSSTSEVKVRLSPGRSVLVHLKSRKTTVNVEVDYKVTLKGDVACSYDERYEGSRNWALDVNDLLEAIDKPTEFFFTEEMEIEYHSEGEIELARVNERCSSTNRYCIEHGINDYNTNGNRFNSNYRNRYRDNDSDSDSDSDNDSDSDSDSD